MQWTCLSKKEASAHLFGPCTWSMIHYVALAYPTVPDHQQQQDYKSFVESLQKVLPCQKCRDHMAVHLRETPVAAFLCPKANILSSTGPSTFTIGSTQTVENRPMIRKSLGPSTNTGTDVGISPYMLSCAPSSSLSYASYCS
jgi:hypothetical protein